MTSNIEALQTFEDLHHPQGRTHMTTDLNILDNPQTFGRKRLHQHHVVRGFERERFHLHRNKYRLPLCDKFSPTHFLENALTYQQVLRPDEIVYCAEQPCRYISARPR